MKKKKTISVSKDVVQGIREKDLTAMAMKEVICSYLEMHALDETTASMNSAVFKGYQQQYAGARVAFEDAKDTMLKEFVPEEDRGNIASWNLDYGTCTLSLIVNE